MNVGTKPLCVREPPSPKMRTPRGTTLTPKPQPHSRTTRKQKDNTDSGESTIKPIDDSCARCSVKKSDCKCDSVDHNVPVTDTEDSVEHNVPVANVEKETDKDHQPKPSFIIWS